MLKRFVFLGKFALAVSIAVGAITLVTYEEHKASDKYQRDCQSHVASITSAGNNNNANRADQCQDPKQYMPWWYVLMAWPDGITAWALLATLCAIIWQSNETRRAAKATEDSVKASRDSLKVQEAEFVQWVDIGGWSVEKDPDVHWVRSGTQIHQHPGEMKVRTRFPLLNNTTRPLFIGSVQTVLEIGPEKTIKTFLIEESRQVPPKGEYSVVIDLKFTEPQVTQYIAFTLFVLATVHVHFSNALGKPDEVTFQRLVGCRAGEETHTVTQGHIAKETDS